MSTTDSSRGKGLHWAGLIVGLFATGWLTLYMVFGYLTAGVERGLGGWYGVLLAVVPALLLLGGVALAWKRPLAGGIVLVVESLLPVVVMVVNNLVLNPGTLWFSPGFRWYLIYGIVPVLCLPLLVAGALCLVSRQKGGRPLAEVTNKMSTTDSSHSQALRWAGLIFGLAFAGLFTLRIAAAAAAWEFWPVPVLLAGIAIAWKWPFVGGLILIVEGLSLMAVNMIVSPPMQDAIAVLIQLLYITFFYSLPLLVSGVLFILSGREG